MRLLCGDGPQGYLIECKQRLSEASAFSDFAEQELVTQRSPPSQSTAPQMRRVHAIFTLAAPRRQTSVSARLFRVPHAFRSILDFGDDVRMMLPHFLVSDQRDPALAPCVQRLLASNEKAAPEAVGDALNALTERELHVLALVALDQSNKEVARSLNVSTETVKTHLKNNFAKLDVQQRWQAAELARSLGLLDEQ